MDDYKEIERTQDYFKLSNLLQKLTFIMRELVYFDN